VKKLYPLFQLKSTSGRVTFAVIIISALKKNFFLMIFFEKKTQNFFRFDFFRKGMIFFNFIRQNSKKIQKKQNKKTQIFFWLDFLFFLRLFYEKKSRFLSTGNILWIQSKI